LEQPNQQEQRELSSPAIQNFTRNYENQNNNQNTTTLKTKITNLEKKEEEKREKDSYYQSCEATC